MARPRNNLRLFVAIHPPPEVGEAMCAAVHNLELPPYRMTRPEQIHMTLHFIGDTAVKDMPQVEESVMKAAGGLERFQVHPRRLIRLPQRGRARLIAAETDGPATLVELHHRLVTRLARTARSRHDDHFLPHITLCRFRSQARMEPIDVPLDIAPLPVGEIHLMRSTLTPTGAEHHHVCVVALGG